jgi:hypothetical protein
MCTGDAHQLFRDPKAASVDVLPSLQDAVDAEDTYSDAPLWNGTDAGWVGCSQQPGGRCFGGISKQEWLSPNRGSACVNTFTDLVEEGLLNESTVPLDICTLSSELEDLCNKIKNAHQLVVSGNCLAARGDDCQPSEWVYTPSMYSSSNQQFVRSTVINFYETYGVRIGTDNVCPVDGEDALIRQRNDELQVGCASRQLEAIKIALQLFRRKTALLVEVNYILLQLVFTIMRIAIPGINDKVRTCP